MSKWTDRVEPLGRTEIFGRLSRRRLAKLAKACVPQSFQRGELLLEEGAVGLGMFVITQGRVEVFRGEGAGKVELARLSSGDLLGEIALVDELPRSASARALERTECLLITRQAFRSLTRNDPEIAWCIVPTLAARLRSAQRGARGQAAAQTMEFQVLTSPAAEPAAAATARSRRLQPTEVLRKQVEWARLGTRGLGGAARWGDQLCRHLADDLDPSRPGGLERASRRLVVEGFRLPSRLVRLWFDTSAEPDPGPDR